MQVFDDLWVQKQIYKYRNHARYEKPLIYFYATDDYYKSLRSEIDLWIEYLPPKAQSIVISRLHADEHFEQTYNELFVAHIFIQLGYSIEYEKSFMSDSTPLTPDWCVSFRNQSIVVEVFTLNPSDLSQKHRKKLGYFLARISEISINAAIEIDFDDRFSPSQDESRQHVLELRHWLTEANLSGGETLSLDRVSFKFKTNHAKPTLDWTTSANVFSVDQTNTLRENIDKKVKKYKRPSEN